MSRDPELEPYWRDPAVPLSFEQLELRKRVLKEVEANPAGFSMASWEDYTQCGTTRCVAGWAQYLARGRITYGCGFENPDRPDVEVDAIGLLGLTEGEFYAGTTHGLFYSTADTALRQLRKLAAEEA